MKSVIALIVSLFLLISCSKEYKYAYWVNGHLGWNVEWIVNDQPALIAFSSGASKEITPFLVPGNNTIIVRGIKQTEDEYDFDISLKRVNENNYEDTIKLGELVSRNKENSFEIIVTSTLPEWTWNKSDEITTLSDNDVNEIYTIIKKFHQIFSLKDYKLIDSFEWYPWAIDESKNERLETILPRAWASKVMEAEDFDSLKLDFDSIKLFAGKNIVKAYAKNSLGIINAGDGGVEKVQRLLSENLISFPDLYFIKMNGKWAMLL
tara:strand:+ start:745 stop:1536 length:792 start_codon:yes stop_codon:yes gene_type:complete